MAILSERIEGTIINVEVKSSNIKYVSYDTISSNLDVTFNNNMVYRYYDVTWELFTKFRMSDSQGVFLNKEIKKNHKCEKIIYNE